MFRKKIAYLKQEKNKQTKPHHKFYNAAILALEKEQLLTRLEESGIFVKILHMERLEEGDYWVVYTQNLRYMPKTKPAERAYLEEEERDVLAFDIEEASRFIVDKVQEEGAAGTNLERLRCMDAKGLAAALNACDACKACEYFDQDTGLCHAVEKVEGTERTVHDCCIEATETWLMSEADTDKEENNEKRDK